VFLVFFGWVGKTRIPSVSRTSPTLFMFYNIKVCPELFSQNNKEVTILSIGTFMGYPLVCI